MTQGFFLSPTAVQEIFLWRTNTGENLLVFEPICRAAKTLGSLLVSDDAQKAAQISTVLEAWCSSVEFESLLSGAGEARASISIDVARSSLARFSGSESFVAGQPIDYILSGFSALIRADLRARESRSMARIDELLIWQSCLKRFSLHDLALLILSALASKDIISTFDRLLSIKEDPGTLMQIDNQSLSTDLSPQFTSGMRLFALSKFEAAETAYTQAIKKDPHSPSVYLAMSLLGIISGKADQTRQLLEDAQKKSDADLPASIDQLIRLQLEGEAPEVFAEDPVSMALVCFFLLRDRQYERVRDLSQKHLEAYPNDVIMHCLAIEALIMPIRDVLQNDPPLPANLSPEHMRSLKESDNRLNSLLQICEVTQLQSMKRRTLCNLSAVALMQRDFKAAAEFAAGALADNQGSGEAKANLAISMLATGDLPAVIRALHAMPLELKAYGFRLLAEAHYHACSFETALELWKRVLVEEADRLWHLRTLCRMLEVYRLLRDQKSAQSCVDTMLTEFQHEPETLFALGYELWQMNRSDDAIKALRKAKELSLPNMQNWIAWELGRVLFDAEKALAATDEYVSIADKNTDSVQAREFAVALFRAGLLPAAYERAKALRQACGGVVPGITEIETDYLVRQEKLAEARELLQALSRQRPLSVLNRLAVARICASLNQDEETRRELEEIRKLNLSEELRREVDRFSKDFETAASIRSSQPQY